MEPESNPQPPASAEPLPLRVAEARADQSRVTGKDRLIALLSVLLALGFLATSLVSYEVSKRQIRKAITHAELPLTSDTIYSEIQKDLIRPVFISSMMASDTFLRDWALHGEKDVHAIAKYLNEVRASYETSTSFYVSETTRNYYHPDGVLRKVTREEPQDAWYFRVREMREPYEINVDTDTRNPSALTVFINYRVFDYAQNFIGTAGVGLTVETVHELLTDYQKRYQRSVYFVDRDGRVVLFGDKPGHGASHLREAEGLRDIAAQVLSTDGGSFQYSNGGQDYLLNVRWVPELKWFLFVEKTTDEALSDIRRTLHLNIAICVGVTAIVLLLTSVTLNRYQRRLEAMATTDRLTGLLNRHAGEVLMQQALTAQRRNPRPMCTMLIDIDHFKNINDRHGHPVGDRMIQHVATLIRGGLRASDVACRWGGEEFLVLLPDCSAEHAATIGEKLRHRIANTPLALDWDTLSVTVSVGMTVHRSGDTADQIFERTDRALYIAKNGGRDQLAQA